MLHLEIMFPTSFINNISGAFWNPCDNFERQIQMKTMIVLTYTTDNWWNSMTGNVSDFKTDRMWYLSNLGTHITQPLSTLYLYTKCLCWLNMSFISLGFHSTHFLIPSHTSTWQHSEAANQSSACCLLMNESVPEAPG